MACSENNGADQLCSYSRIDKSPVFSLRGSFDPIWHYKSQFCLDSDASSRNHCTMV